MHRRTPAAVAVAVLALCSGMAGCSPLLPFTRTETRLFVSNYRDDTVSVVAGNPDREIKVIEVGGSPFGLAARTKNPLVAVANSTGFAVTLIDPIRMEVLRKIEVEDIPEHVVFSVDGARLFVTLPKAKAVAVIDPDRGVVDGDPIRLERKPKRLAVSPDGRRLYVLLHTQDGGVAVVNIAQRTVEAIVPTGRFPSDFGMTRDGRRIVTANFDDNTVSVIDTEALRVIATHPIRTGLGLIVHPTKPIVYSMASFDDEVHVLDYETGALIATLNVGTWPTYGTITPDGRYVYIPNEDADNVAKLDTEKNQRAQLVAVGGAPANAVVFEER